MDFDSEPLKDEEQLDIQLNNLKAIFFLLRNGKFNEAQEIACNQQFHELELLLMSFVPRHENLNSTEFGDFDFYWREDLEHKVVEPQLNHQISI